MRFIPTLFGVMSIVLAAHFFEQNNPWCYLFTILAAVLLTLATSYDGKP